MKVRRFLVATLLGISLGPVVTADVARSQSGPAGSLALEGCWVFAFSGGVKSICVERGGQSVRYNHNADFGVCSTVGTVAASGSQIFMNFYRNETGCLGNTAQNRMEYRCILESPQHLRCDPVAYRQDGGTNVLGQEVYRRL